MRNKRWNSRSIITKPSIVMTPEGHKRRVDISGYVIKQEKNYPISIGTKAIYFIYN